MKKVLTLLFVASLLSCSEDEIAKRVIPDYPPSNAIIQTISLAGKIIDENGDALPSVKVSVNTASSVQTETSDENGVFQFTDISIKGDYAYLRYDKNEYFDGFQSLPIIANSYNYTKAKLKKQNVTNLFSADVDGEISLTNGTEILIPKNSLIDNNGNEYFGEVKAYVKYVDPTSDDFQEEIIGGLTGIGLNDNIVGLQSYGMVQVELLGKNGQELNLNGIQKAEIEFPIPTGMTNLPTEVPVWSFDEDQGIWIEEETATLGEGKYLTAVSHFSAWNLDIIITDPVSLFGEIYVDNIPAASQVVRIKFTDGTSIGGSLNENGEFDLKLFPNDLDFSVCLLNQCGVIIDTEKFSGIQANDSIKINFKPMDIELGGTAFNCDGLPIKKGVVIYNQLPYPIDSLGYFRISHCPEIPNQVIVIDGENSNSKLFTLSDNQSFENLQVCTDPNAQFIVSMIGRGCVQNSPVESYQCDAENNHTIIFNLFEQDYKVVRHIIRFQIPASYTLPLELSVDFPIEYLSLYCPGNEGGNFNSSGGFWFSDILFSDTKKVIITDYVPNETIKGRFDFITTYQGTLPTMSFELSKTE